MMRLREVQDMFKTLRANIAEIRRLSKSNNDLISQNESLRSSINHWKAQTFCERQKIINILLVKNNLNIEIGEYSRKLRELDDIKKNNFMILDRNILDYEEKIRDVPSWVAQYETRNSRLREQYEKLPVVAAPIPSWRLRNTCSHRHYW